MSARNLLNSNREALEEEEDEEFGLWAREWVERGDRGIERWDESERIIRRRSISWVWSEGWTVDNSRSEFLIKNFLGYRRIRGRRGRRLVEGRVNKLKNRVGGRGSWKS
jgi:hypothetical protein